MYRQEETRLRLGDLKSLPTLPSVMQRVLSVLKEDKASAQDLEEIIKFDKSLSLKILGLANTAVYGFPRKVESISEALVILGFDLVKVLALSLPIFDLKKGSPRMASFLKDLWAHSCKTAFLASCMAAELSPAEQDGVFLCGLLADVGRAAFVHLMPDEYVAAVKGTDSAAMLEVEKSLFGADHAVASGWITDDFLLPEDVVMAARHHHDPMACDDWKKRASFIYLSDYFLSQDGGPAGAGYMYPRHGEVMDFLGLYEERFFGFVHDLINRSELGETMKPR